MASLSIPFIPFLSCFHPQLSIQEKRREKRWRKRKTREGNGANSQGHTPYLYLTLAPFCPFPISFHFSSLPISISHLHKILDWWVNGKREERNGPSLSFLSTIIFLSFGRVWWTRKRWKEMNGSLLSLLFATRSQAFCIFSWLGDEGVCEVSLVSSFHLTNPPFASLSFLFSVGSYGRLSRNPFISDHRKETQHEWPKGAKGKIRNGKGGWAIR